MAFNLLVNKAGVKPGEWVLVMGATGALGSSCVQVAKMLGAKVIAGAGADERVERVETKAPTWGELSTCMISLTKSCGSRTIRAWTSFVRISPTRTLWPAAFASLALNGRLVTAGAHGGGTVPST